MSREFARSRRRGGRRSSLFARNLFVVALIQAPLIGGFLGACRTSAVKEVPDSPCLALDAASRLLDSKIASPRRTWFKIQDLLKICAASAKDSSVRHRALRLAARVAARCSRQDRATALFMIDCLSLNRKANTSFGCQPSLAAPASSPETLSSLEIVHQDSVGERWPDLLLPIPIRSHLARPVAGSARFRSAGSSHRSYPRLMRPSQNDTLSNSMVSGFAIDLKAAGLTAGRAPARVRAVRCWHNSNRLRLALFLSSPQSYTNGVLAPTNGKPARLYLDVTHVQWSSAMERRLKLCAAGPVVRVRTGRGRRQRMRVVFDIKGPTRYRILAFASPFRILVDFTSASARRDVNGGHRIEVVAIDPGHGGQSRGAIGPGHTMEKNVVLAVARHLATFLRKHGLKPIMTRIRDVTRSLDDRTAIAFSAGADLFISIHANAEVTGRRQAVETYYLDIASDDFSARLANRENAVANGPVTALRFRRAIITEARLTKQSAVLARLIHKNVLSAVRRILPETKDGHVRKALFYVLLTARVPAVLVELSYITHKDAEQRLRSTRVQQSLAEAIGRGILAYTQRQRRHP